MIHKKLSCQDLLEKAQGQYNKELSRANHLQGLAEYDAESGLLRHHMMVRRINSLINEKKESFAYGIIRLDRHYRRIRRTRDRHKVLLFVTAERLKKILGDNNLYQSDRSDEFRFIIPFFGTEEDLKEQVFVLIDTVREFHNPPASDISFGCHVGITLFPDHAETLEKLEINAEIALGVQEEVKRNDFFYSPEMGLIYHENGNLEAKMRHDILKGFRGFHVVYQPLVDGGKNLLGCEALIRWEVPGYGMISPSRFIPLAEKSGPIIYIGKWVLYQALGQVKSWRQEVNTDIFVSVNMSLSQIENPDCVDMVDRALKAHDLPGEALQIEITENMIMEDPQAVQENLSTFQKMNIAVMLDDFGTGYSSLAVLNTLPVNTLKIAKEIIDNFPDNLHSLEIVRAIMSISESFGFTTLAEGIEEERQFKGLIDLGCDIIQGYLVSRPLSADEFQKNFLEKDR